VKARSRFGLFELIFIAALSSIALVVARVAGVTAPVPIHWLLIVTLGTQFFTGALNFVKDPESELSFHVRFAIQMLSVAAIVYAIGLGPVLAIGYAFVAAQNVALYGSRAARPLALWALVAIAGGEFAVALGAPSMLTPAQSHGIAGLMAVCQLFMMNIIHGAALDREEAASAMANSERRLRQLLSYAGDAILVLSPTGEITFASDAIEQLTGRTPEEMVGQPPATDLVNLDDLARIRGGDGAEPFLAEPGRVFRGDIRLRFGDEERWCHVTAANRSDDPLIGGVLINAHDISDRKRTEELLAHEAATLEMIAKGEPIDSILANIAAVAEEHTGSICVVRAVVDDRLVVRSAPSLDATQRASFEVEATPELLALYGADTTGIATAISEYADDPVVRGFLAEGITTCWTMPIPQSSRERIGGTFSLLLSVEAPSDDQVALVRRFVAVASVAIEQDLARSELSHRAFHDDLTGLPNRALLRDRLEQALRRAARTATPVAVLFFDLDRFKLVNDSLGHDAGDSLLAQVADRLRAHMRSADTIARIGGDEFVVVVEGVLTDADLTAAVLRVSEALAEPFDVEGERIHVTASVGLRLATSEEELDEVLRDADDAMYVAKRRGRGTVHVHDAVHADRTDRLAQLNSLHDAVARNEFIVHYQPIVALDDHRLVGAEALVRWQHPERGLLAPGHFIPLAEDSGLIVDIGRHVLRDALERLREWPGIDVAVNVSARQLDDPNFVDELEALLVGHDVSRLTLEVTESMLLGEGGATAISLRRLDELGARIALDDFGTGFSSLSSLTRFPIGQLKVDRSFITDIARRPDHETLVRGVVELGHALGLEVIAEGVETDAQERTLVRLGCRLAQGYAFGKPGPAEQITQMLAARTTA
jgi:diguanylate cyclase (GGDEF)-like protein/PAS domain S-box-containing protein